MLSKIRNKASISVLTISIQLCTVGFSQYDKARKGNKSMQIRQKEGKLSLLDGMTTYIKSLMKSIKKATRSIIVKLKDLNKISSSLYTSNAKTEILI